MSEASLRKAIALLNTFWLAYREEICADQTDQIVWKSPRRLILRSGCLERTKRKRPDTSSPLMVFPEHLYKKPHDKAILLNFLQCKVAVTHMQCVLDWLPKDISQKTEVVVFLLKDPPLTVTFEPDGGCSTSNAGYRHVCWRVTLKTGNIYAVDVTGAQYGWFDSVCPWQECLEKRCDNEAVLRIGFNDDDRHAPLIASTFNILTSLPPKVDNYYVSVCEHFSRTIKVHLGTLKVEDLFVHGYDKESPQVLNLTKEVKRQAAMATLAADEIWNTFPWAKVMQDRLDAVEKERIRLFGVVVDKFQM